MTRMRMTMFVLCWALTLGSLASSQEVLSFIASAGGSGNSFSAAIERFNELHAGEYEVEVTLVPWETVQQREILQFVSGSATYDVMAVDAQWLPGVKHYLEPLDSYVAEAGFEPAARFGEGALAQMDYQGSLVAFPVRLGVIINYFRQDLLDEAGLDVPMTLDDYYEAAEVLTVRDAGGDVEVYGTSLMAQHPTWTTWTFTQFANPYGVYLLDQETFDRASESLTSETSIRVLTFLQDLALSGNVPDPLAWTYDDNVVAFQNGRLAMAAEFSQRAGLIEDAEQSQVAGSMGYSVLPSEAEGPLPPSYAGGYWTLAIDKNSTSKEAAFKLIEFLTSTEVQRELALEHANGPTNLDVITDPEYQSANPAAGAVQDALQTIGYSAQLPVEQNAELSQAVHEEMQKLLLGETSPEETANAIYARLNEILSE